MWGFDLLRRRLPLRRDELAEHRIGGEQAAGLIDNQQLKGEDQLVPLLELLLNVPRDRHRFTPLTAIAILRLRTGNLTRKRRKHRGATPHIREAIEAAMASLRHHRRTSSAVRGRLRDRAAAPPQRRRKRAPGLRAGHSPCRRHGAPGKDLLPLPRSAGRLGDRRHREGRCGQGRGGVPLRSRHPFEPSRRGGTRQRDRAAQRLPRPRTQASGARSPSRRSRSW